MKICCENGKEILTNLDLIGCRHDHCTGPKDMLVNQPKSWIEAYKALTHEDWMNMIKRANEMQLETLRKAEEMKEQDK